MAAEEFTDCCGHRPAREPGTTKRPTKDHAGRCGGHAELILQVLRSECDKASDERLVSNSGKDHEDKRRVEDERSATTKGNSFSGINKTTHE